MKAWNQFLDEYYPDANRADRLVVVAYMAAQALEHVLKACGDNLTRENVMKQAASLMISNWAASCRASSSTLQPPTLHPYRSCNWQDSRAKPGSGSVTLLVQTLVAEPS